jgi:hypothetical protein
VRAVFGGDATRPRLESAPVSITVVPKLTLALSSRRLRAGRVVGVSGTMLPAQSTLVVCTVERRVGRRWKRVQSKRIAVRGGKFSTRIRERRASLYRITISAPNATIRGSPVRPLGGSDVARRARPGTVRHECLVTRCPNRSAG